MSAAGLVVRDLDKVFTLHAQGGMHLPVLHNLSFAVAPGECVVLSGASGIGKSTVLRLIYGNYRARGGSIAVRHRENWVELVEATPSVVLDLRRWTIGYVSQFLRVLPRIPTLRIVMQPLLAQGVGVSAARGRAMSLLQHLRVPERLWQLPPATFSGGEQQRVNLARAFAVPWPIMLLDEPTASLNSENRGAAVELIARARDRGAAILGVFHDEAVRNAVATRMLTVEGARTAHG